MIEFIPQFSSSSPVGQSPTPSHKKSRKIQEPSNEHFRRIMPHAVNNTTWRHIRFEKELDERSCAYDSWVRRLCTDSCRIRRTSPKPEYLIAPRCRCNQLQELNYMKKWRHCWEQVRALQRVTSPTTQRFVVSSPAVLPPVALFLGWYLLSVWTCVIFCVIYGTETAWRHGLFIVLATCKYRHARTF